MENIQILIDQMVSEIDMQAARLDNVRRGLFLEWLKAHSSCIKATTQSNKDAELRNYLKLWLRSLPMQGLLWEYHLVLTETYWWQDLDELSLAGILKTDRKE